MIYKLQIKLLTFDHLCFKSLYKLLLNFPFEDIRISIYVLGLNLMGCLNKFYVRGR